MTDQELIGELVSQNLITAAVGDSILQENRLSGQSAEDLIYDRRLISEEAVAQAKSTLLRIPYKKIDPAGVKDEVLRLVPKETSRAYQVVPVDLNNGLLVVAMLRPDDTKAQEALRFIAKQHQVSLGIYIATPSLLNALWRRYAPYSSEVEMAVKEVNSKVSEEDDLVELEEGGDSEEAPVIKIVASTLREAIEVGSSDIHFEPQRQRLRVRFRIDGDLQEAASLPRTLMRPVIARVKVLARLKLDETRVPQDGRFRTRLFGRDIDYRVATFPTPNGEKVAIRVLDATSGLKDFKGIGLSEFNYRILEEGIGRPYGMILISGPTGSGKTTTLYSIMQRLNKDEVNIVSLEDPVEYFIEGVNQSQVKPEIGYDFASGLRQILRQDPDVIMVGEIRDKETAGLAVNAALTGHIMLSTIHTNNSVGVIPRLTDLGVPPFLLSSALNLMIAQRLVGRLCQDCRQEAKAPAEIEKIISESLDSLPPVVREKIPFKPPYKIFQAGNKNDCKTCKGKGIAGRIAIFEIFRMTRELGDLINAGFTESKLMDQAKKQGMVTMRQDGIIKALAGQVSIEAILKETGEMV